jgi:hypothetical protein
MTGSQSTVSSPFFRIVSMRSAEAPSALSIAKICSWVSVTGFSNLAVYAGSPLTAAVSRNRRSSSISALSSGVSMSSGFGAAGTAAN